MNNFFISIYSWFCNWSDNETVFKIMDAVKDDDGEILLSSSLTTLGITAAVISLVLAVAFYIWPINHPRFKAWWAWLIMLVTNAAINFGLTFAFIHSRVSSISNNEDYEGIMGLLELEEPLEVPFAQSMNLALSNVCVSVIFFIIVSLILNWFSTNCRFSPFRK